MIAAGLKKMASGGMIPENEALAAGFLMKYALFCALHVTDSVGFTFYLADRYLGMDLDEQIAFDVQLVSTCIEIYTGAKPGYHIAKEFQPSGDQMQDQMTVMS